jgi:flagellar protein FliS
MYPPAPSTNRYLESRVRTASQPELQLMMLDGALRFGQQARKSWDDDAAVLEVDRLVRRVLDIVEELVRSVGGDRTAEATRLEEEYAYAFRQLGAAHLDHDAAAFDKGLELLAFQRETWRLACEKMKSSPTPAPTIDYGDSPVAGFSFQA